MRIRSSCLTFDLSAVSQGLEDCSCTTCVSEILAFRQRKAEINVGKGKGVLVEVKASAEEIKNRLR